MESAASDVTDNRHAPVPVNVRAVMRNGDVIPLELICLGRRRGKWRWVAAWRLREPPARVDYDHLPDDTTFLINSGRPHGA